MYIYICPCIPACIYTNSYIVYIYIFVLRIYIYIHICSAHVKYTYVYRYMYIYILFLKDFVFVTKGESQQSTHNAMGHTDPYPNSDEASLEY